jgi:Sulfotransferase family
MSGLKRRLLRHIQLPRRVTHRHSLCSAKERRLAFAAALSLLCLAAVSLVFQEEFIVSFMHHKNAYQQHTASSYLLMQLLNETTVQGANVRTKNASSTSSNGILNIQQETTSLLHDGDDISNFALEPMWNCTSTSNKEDDDATVGRRKKLLFVHVFKTAGSTMRAFFQGYGKRCFHTGVAIVSQCSGLSSAIVVVPANESSSSSMIWTNHRGGACVLQTFQPRRRADPPTWIHDDSIEAAERHQHQQRLVGKPRLARSFLRATTDVLIGHFPLGVHEHWLVSNNSSSNGSKNNVSVTTTTTTTTASSEEEDFSYQYVVFFRDPLHKLVSGYLYNNRMRHNLTTEQATNALYDRIWKKHNAAQRLYHDGYASYLLTPRQKHIISRLHKGGIKNTTEDSIKHSMDVIKSNLLEMRVMVGIVEQMTSSLALLRHLIDGRGELTAAWKALDSSTSSSAAAAAKTSEQLQRQEQNKQPFTLNKSRLSTSAIARRLQQRDAALFREHLRYEQDLYDFAMQIHERQYRANIMGHQ